MTTVQQTLKYKKNITSHALWFLANVANVNTICYRPSICRLSVIGNARAPYSGG